MRVRDNVGLHRQRTTPGAVKASTHDVSRTGTKQKDCREKYCPPAAGFLGYTPNNRRKRSSIPLGRDFSFGPRVSDQRALGWILWQ
jgi:hypothetical protein